MAAVPTIILLRAKGCALAHCKKNSSGPCPQGVAFAGRTQSRPVFLSVCLPLFATRQGLHVQPID